MRSKTVLGAALAAAVVWLSWSAAGSLSAEETAAPARGPGRGAGYGRGPWRGGRGADAQFEADRQLFHLLLENHEAIRRSVKKRDDGVETVTESDDPNVALAIQGHVASMKRRVDKVQPIHMRDPLFRALFGSAKKIVMTIEKTDKGVRVVETSDDPYVALLIQAHADVVSLFVANAHAEVRKNHQPPQPISTGE